MMTSSTNGYSILSHSPGLPFLYDEYVKHSKLSEQFDFQNSEGSAAFLAVGKQNEWPSLVIALRCVPGEDAAFYPGILLVPETEVLFVGGGCRVIAYDLTQPSRLWTDSADTGFWGWARYGDVVLMSAELEFAAWDIKAKKLWTMFVEPPWSYEVAGGIVSLDVMGSKSTFNVTTGPST